MQWGRIETISMSVTVTLPISAPSIIYGIYSSVFLTTTLDGNLVIYSNIISASTVSFIFDLDKTDYSSLNKVATWLLFCS